MHPRQKRGGEDKKGRGEKRKNLSMGRYLVSHSKGRSSLREAREEEGGQQEAKRKRVRRVPMMMSHSGVRREGVRGRLEPEEPLRVTKKRGKKRGGTQEDTTGHAS